MEHGDNRQPHAGSVVLDIGPEAGALIIYTGSELHGREIEVSRSDIDEPKVHTDVLLRLVNGRSVYAAVFAELRPGPYTVWGSPGRPAGAVTIVGGEVAEVDWRS